MKTRTLILFLFSVIFFTKSNAQSNIIPDARLYECFDSAFIKNTTISNPVGILYYNFYLDNSFYIAENNTEKPTTGTLDIYKVKKTISNDSKINEFFNIDLSNFDIKKLNVLMYDFNIDFNKYTTYKLGKTGKLLIFFPKSVFIDMFNEYKKSLGYK